jgi:hypothetical protein
MRSSRLMVLAALAGGGCFLDRERPPGPDATRDALRVRQDPAVAQANIAACTRVYSLGVRILVANEELPRPMTFQAVGHPHPEIFHRGTSTIIVTQKIVDMCRTDGELAAVLCVELGRMVAEREALAPLEARQPTPHAPPEGVAIRDASGVSNPDPMRLRELAHYEEEQRRRTGSGRLPDPLELARTYLTRTGFDAEEMEKIKPILRAAAEHSDVEQLMNPSNRRSPFTPPGGA